MPSTNMEIPGVVVEQPTLAITESLLSRTTSAVGSTTPSSEIIADGPLRLENLQESHRAAKSQDEYFDEPLVDTTAALTLRSKKTERLQKRQQKKSEKKAVHSDTKSFLELPSELLMEVLSFLRPSDVFSLMEVSRATKEYIEDNEHRISRSLIDMRYPSLAKSFPLPVLFNKLDSRAQIALLSARHQRRLVIHKAPYQHVRPADAQNTCSCMTCVMAWNNLCLILDLAHWQNNLTCREPIPMIARGSRPQWNQELVEANAAVVEKAIRSPLCHARILEMHLQTTTNNILRFAAIRGKRGSPIRDVPAERRLFHLSKSEAEAGTDTFLERSGPPNFEFPYHRDNYYTLVAYLPNRRWKDGCWIYYGDLHERDLEWAIRMAEREGVLEPLVSEHSVALTAQMPPSNAATEAKPFSQW